MKKFLNKEVKIPDQVEHKFIDISDRILYDRSWKFIIICALYLSCLSVGFKEGGSQLKTVVQYGIISYFMTPIIDELQMIVEMMYAQINKTIETAKTEAKDLRKKIIHQLNDMFDDVINLDQINKILKEGINETINGVSNVLNFANKICNNRIKRFGFDPPNNPVPDNPIPVPDNPIPDNPIPNPTSIPISIPDNPPIPIPNPIPNIPLPDPSIIEEKVKEKLNEIIKNACPGSIVIPTDFLDAINFKFPKIIFKLNLTEKINTTRGSEQVKQEVNNRINSIFDKVRYFFGIITIVWPILISLIILFINIRDLNKAVNGKKIKRKRKNYTVKQYIATLWPILGTIFVLTVFLLIYYMICLVNDIMADHLYFIYRTDYSLDFVYKAANNGTNSGMFDSITATRKTNGNYTLMTKAEYDNRPSKISVKDVVIVYILCTILLFLGFVRLMTANLRGEFLSFVSEQKCKENGKNPVYR